MINAYIFHRFSGDFRLSLWFYFTRSH